jgi:hypothetical protein
MSTLPDTVTRAIAALKRHARYEAAECLAIELILFNRGRISAFRLRHTANSLLSTLS